MSFALKETSRRIIIGKIIFKASWFIKPQASTTNNVPISDLPYSFQEFLQKIKLFADDEKNIDLNQIESELKNIDEAGQSEVERRKEMQENIQLCKFFTKNQIRIDEGMNRAIILFDYIDVFGADVTYKNNRTLVLKHNIKAQDEGVNYSAHLIINLTETAIPGVFNAALECVPQLSTSVINGVLSKICNYFRNKSRNDFLIDSPTGELDRNGNPVKKAIRISIEFKPDVSEDFFTLLAKRKSIISLSLIQSNFENDTAPILTVKRQELFLSSPDEDFYNDYGEKTWGNIQIISSWGNDHGYTKTKLKLKDEDNIIKTVIIDNSDFSFIDETHFTKTKTINGLSKMPTGCDTINDQFVEKVWTHIR